MTSLHSIFRRAVAALALVGSTTAGASVVSVDARLNSRIGGSGAAVAELALGQQFSLSASEFDTWSAGALRGSLLAFDPMVRKPGNMRVSTQTRANADGLTGIVRAQAQDDSGVAAGTVIGRSFVLYDDGSFAAPYASLVGQIGDGDYFLVGTGYSSAADRAGLLKLYFWDTSAFDNTGQVSVDVNLADIAGDTVPEPATAGLVLGALGALALSRRRPARA